MERAARIAVFFRAVAAYFGSVFGVGFVLGILRVSILVPMLGDRTAELIEAPLMLTTIVLSARWVQQNLLRYASELFTLLVGVFAVALVLSADVLVGTFLRGMSLRQVFFDRDMVAGSVYYFLLVGFGLMPWFWRKVHQRTTTPRDRS